MAIIKAARRVLLSTPLPDEKNRPASVPRIIYSILPNYRAELHAITAAVSYRLRKSSRYKSAITEAKVIVSRTADPFRTNKAENVAAYRSTTMSITRVAK